MLNRRYLRVKIMQALYAFTHAGSSDVRRAEEDLFEANDSVYELHLSLISLFSELKFCAERLNEDNQKKLMPTEEDLNPNLRFLENPIMQMIADSAKIQNEINRVSISWVGEYDVVRKLYNNIRTSEAYNKYVNSPELSFNDHRDFMAMLVADFFEPNEVLLSYFEEKSIFWNDDFYFACHILHKNIASLKETDSIDTILPTLYKDEKEDVEFVKTLFRKSIMYAEEHANLISEKTDNWETERIAAMDMLLMNMALTEVREFSSIPVKVSLNEYIEISKYYSSPKSKVFINGILDKIIIDWKRDQKINKTGRGLLE